VLSLLEMGGVSLLSAVEVVEILHSRLERDRERIGRRRKGRRGKLIQLDEKVERDREDLTNSFVSPVHSSWIVERSSSPGTSSPPPKLFDPPSPPPGTGNPFKPNCGRVIALRCPLPSGLLIEPMPLSNTGDPSPFPITGLEGRSFEEKIAEERMRAD